MNERIQELAKLAQEDYVGYQGKGLYYEIFAKLIVQECMNVLDPGENQLIARFQARQWLAEHFGMYN